MPQYQVTTEAGKTFTLTSATPLSDREILMAVQRMEPTWVSRAFEPLVRPLTPMTRAWEERAIATGQPWAARLAGFAHGAAGAVEENTLSPVGLATTLLGASALLKPAAAAKPAAKALAKRAAKVPGAAAAKPAPASAAKPVAKPAAAAAAAPATKVPGAAAAAKSAAKTLAKPAAKALTAAAAKPALAAAAAKPAAKALTATTKPAKATLSAATGAAAATKPAATALAKPARAALSNIPSRTLGTPTQVALELRRSLEASGGAAGPRLVPKLPLSNIPSKTLGTPTQVALELRRSLEAAGPRSAPKLSKAVAPKLGEALEAAADDALRIAASTPDDLERIGALIEARQVLGAERVAERLGRPVSEIRQLTALPSRRPLVAQVSELERDFQRLVRDERGMIKPDFRGFAKTLFQLVDDAQRAAMLTGPAILKSGAGAAGALGTHLAERLITHAINLAPHRTLADLAHVMATLPRGLRAAGRALVFGENVQRQVTRQLGQRVDLLSVPAYRLMAALDAPAREALQALGASQAQIDKLLLFGDPETAFSKGLVGIDRVARALFTPVGLRTSLNVIDQGLARLPLINLWPTYSRTAPHLFARNVLGAAAIKAGWDAGGQIRPDDYFKRGLFVAMAGPYALPFSIGLSLRLSNRISESLLDKALLAVLREQPLHPPSLTTSPTKELQRRFQPAIFRALRPNTPARGFTRWSSR